MTRHLQGDMKWTPADRARHNAIREKFQKKRPTPEQLRASGDHVGPIPHGLYLSLMAALRDLIRHISRPA